MEEQKIENNEAKIEFSSGSEIKAQCGYCYKKFNGVCPLFRLPIKNVNRPMARICIKRVRKAAKR